MKNKASEIKINFFTDDPELQQVLKKRALILAKTLQLEGNSELTMNALGFLLSDETYYIDSKFVVEVLPLMELTPLPCTPDFILGIINVRGRILSVINLKSFLELPERGITNLNRVLVVRNKDIEVGLLVDEVVGNEDLELDQLQSGLLTHTASQKEYLIGVTKNRSVVLDIQKFLEDEKIIINETL